MSVADDLLYLGSVASKLPAPAIRAARLLAERVQHGDSVQSALLKVAEIMAAEAAVQK